MEIAFITGGARGIGREVARRLVDEGRRVIVGVRDPAKAPREVEAIELDIASEASIAACAERVRGPIDVLVNNAALYRVPARQLWPVNVRGPILLTRALAPKLADDARVVNVTSGLGRLAGQPRELSLWLADPSLTIDDLLALPPAGYGESKAVLNAFTRLLAREWPRRVVNSVDPGWVQSDMGGPRAPRTLDQGAESVLFCCRLRPGAPSGRVFWDGQEVGY